MKTPFALTGKHGSWMAPAFPPHEPGFRCLQPERGCFDSAKDPNCRFFVNATPPRMPGGGENQYGGQVTSVVLAHPLKKPDHMRQMFAGHAECRP